MRLGFFKVAKTRDVFRTMQGWKLFASQIPVGLDFETTGPTRTLAIPMCSLILKWIEQVVCKFVNFKCIHCFRHTCYLAIFKLVDIQRHVYEYVYFQMLHVYGIFTNIYHKQATIHVGKISRLPWIFWVSWRSSECWMMVF